MVTEREDYAPVRITVRTQPGVSNLVKVCLVGILLVYLSLCGFYSFLDNVDMNDNQRHKTEQYSISDRINDIKHAVKNNQIQIVKTLLSDDKLIIPAHTIDYLLLISINHGYLEIVELLILSGKFNPSVGGIYTMARAAQEKYDRILGLVFVFDKNGQLVNKDKKVVMSHDDYSLACIFRHNGYGHPFNIGCSRGIISPDQSLLLIWMEIVKNENHNLLLNQL